MTPAELLLNNYPANIRKEYMICQCCGNIVTKQNYCSVCDCKLDY